MRKLQAIADARESLATIVAQWQTIEGDDRREVLKQAALLYFDEFCPWAAVVIDDLGLADSADPGDPPRVEWETKPWNPCQIVAGTPNAVEAGKRVIFWSAAHHDPELCQRTFPSYKVTVRDWAHEWLVIPVEQAGFRTFHQALNWAATALKHLARQVDGTQAPPSGKGPQGTGLGDERNDPRGEGAERKPRKRTCVSRDEYNARARLYLSRHPSRDSQRTIAKAIGCAPGLVGRLPAYIAHREGKRWNAERNGPAANGGLIAKATSSPTTVGLTDELLSTVADRSVPDPQAELLAEEEADLKQAELRRLIAEQAAEMELDSAAGRLKRRRKL